MLTKLKKINIFHWNFIQYQKKQNGDKSVLTIKAMRPGYKIIVILFLLSCVTASAQEVTLRGVVKNANTHKEISGVNIFVKGTSVGAVSDNSGKYILWIRESAEDMTIVFQHIAFERKEMPFHEVQEQRNIYLQPRVIPMPGAAVEGKRRLLEIEKDLPQAVSVIEAERFEIQGFQDAGDLLRTEQSIQVDDELSGKKTASIRAGNPDEVIVLYNGTKINSTYNNIADLSIIDLEDVERVEIIKGSNTVLYGSEAFSGVINLVPKVQQNYNARFQQRIGTYDSGNWGLHIHQNLHGLYASYSMRQGSAARYFSGSDGSDKQLKNNSAHYSVNMEYNFAEENVRRGENSVGAMYVHSSTDYENERDEEALEDFEEIASFNFNGDLFRIKHIDFSASRRHLEETQVLTSYLGTLDRRLDDTSLNLNFEKSAVFDRLEQLVAYQYEDADLDFSDERFEYKGNSSGLESSVLKRRRHGFVSITKFHSPSKSEVVSVTDFDVSFRHDVVQDRQYEPVLRGDSSDVGLFNRNEWEKTTYKISSNISGRHENTVFNGYLNFGTNVKFPTLFQQISSTQTVLVRSTEDGLTPEEAQSTEIGLEVTGEIRSNPSVNGYRLNANIFQNRYSNKLRVSFPLGTPVAFYENVGDAKISGAEGKAGIFLFRKKVTFEYGISRYFISEKSAFPFKHDMKQIINLFIDHAGFSVQMHIFNEGEQVGWIRGRSGGFTEITLPGFSNIDVHMKKSFEWGKMKLFANFSVRNAISDELVLEGFALRDRRVYLTVGAQI